MGQHKSALIGDIHIIHNAEYDTLVAMQAVSYTSADIGKVVRIPTEGGIDRFYIVNATTPTFSLIPSIELAEVTTSNATETNLYELTTVDDYVYHVEAVVIGTVNAGGNAATYVRKAGFKNDSGTLSIIGSTTSDHTAENDSNWDVQIETDGGTAIQVNVTGVAATVINWTGYITIFTKANGI